MDNLEEVDRFLEKFSLPRLSQEEIEIINNPIASTENWSCDQTSPKKTKAKDETASQENSIKHLERGECLF